MLRVNCAPMAVSWQQRNPLFSQLISFKSGLCPRSFFFPCLFSQIFYSFQFKNCKCNLFEAKHEGRYASFVLLYLLTAKLFLALHSFNMQRIVEWLPENGLGWKGSTSNPQILMYGKTSQNAQLHPHSPEHRESSPWWRFILITVIYK